MTLTHFRTMDDWLNLIHDRLSRAGFVPAAMSVSQWTGMREALAPLFDETRSCQSVPTVDELYCDPSTPTWIKGALARAVQHDPIDAAQAAEVLARALIARADAMLADAKRA